MRVLVYNQKGGCGKTTTAINLGAAMARLGDEVVTLVDLDPQTHLTAALGRRVDGSAWTVTQWLAGVQGSALPVSERLFLVPGDCEAQEPRPFGNPLAGASGIILIDAPPVWSATIARLMAECDVILTPLEPDFLGMQGFNRLLQTMKKHGAPWGRLRILICRYVDHLAIHRQVRERLGELFASGTLLPVVIRNSVRLAEAPGFGRHIFDHAPESSGACDYEAAARLLLGEWRMATTRAERTAGRRACFEAKERGDGDEESVGQARRRAAAQ
jgi:chromosome partitioning protein